MTQAANLKWAISVAESALSRRSAARNADLHPDALRVLVVAAKATAEGQVERVALDEWTVEDVRRSARASIDAPGCGHNVFARAIGIAPAKLSEFLSGKRGAEPSIIEPMGYRWALVNANDYPYPEERDPDHDEEIVYDREGPR